VSADLIIRDVYDPDLLSAVLWLQEHLPFTDVDLAQLIGVTPQLFSDWKRGAQTLTSEQTQTLENLSTTINRLLSFYSFRCDLIVRSLETQTEDQVHRNRHTPPWVGTSLKDHLLAHGAKGIAEVDDWIQTLRSANA
jgi:hypothetical protein